MAGMRVSVPKQEGDGEEMTEEKEKGQELPVPLVRIPVGVQQKGEDGG